MSLSLQIFHQFSDVSETWSELLPKGHHLVSNDLLAIQYSRPPGITFYYVNIYRNNSLIGVMYLQQLEFSHRHFNRNLITNRLLLLADPLLKKLKTNILVCGNLFRVNFQSFYFTDKNERFLVFDCLRLFKRQIRHSVRYSGILVKDCSREFAPVNYHCFKFQPFHQDLTMEMTIRPEWNNFDDYIYSLSKKYRQRAVKIRKSLDGVERRLLTLEEIIQYRNEIEMLYMNVVNKQPMALGILGAEYFIEMKKQLGDLFELMAFMKDGKILAFSGHIYYPAKEAMELHYIGFNYEENPVYNLYFNIIFDGVETAIQRRYKRLEMGRTAREAKASAGAKAVENFNYIWVKGGLPRLALNYFSNRFTDTIGDEWKNRNPFKDAAPAS